MEDFRFALERDGSTLSRVIEFIPVFHCAVNGWLGIPIGIAVTNKSIKQLDFGKERDKRAAAITINQSLLELSNAPFSVGSAGGTVLQAEPCVKRIFPDNIRDLK